MAPIVLAHARRMRAMDEHFRQALIERNMPALDGNAGDMEQQLPRRRDAVAVLPYEQYPSRFPAYLQQLTMESNG
jgi:glucose-6-phosphate isomerase